MQVAAGSIIGGKYRLDRPVSRGGMGAVWAGRHLQLGSPVAVKFMDPVYAGSPAFRARFEREARAAASLQSPHVVGVQDYGIDGDIPYIVMELLEGEDLHAHLERHRRIGLAEASRLLTQLGKALRRAHEAGLVHRDLKPRNIFLARVEDDEIAKILDFGIAKDTVSKAVGESTNTGELMGSPHYMSPEQLRADKDLDGRSDLWSLGVILYRCLTGYLPFPGEALGTVMAKILIDPVPPVAQLAPDLPPSLDAFFARAMARDRAQRFQSVREMVDAFNQIAGGAPLGVTVTGGHMSPFAVPSSEARPRVAMASSPAIEPWPAAAQSSWPTPGSIHHAGTSGATPQVPLPGTPAGTLTTAGMVAGDPFGRARRMRAVWVASIGTVLVVGVVGTMTALRVAGGDEAEPAAGAQPPAAAQPSETATAAPETATAAPEVPSVQPAGEEPIDLDEPAPGPAGTGSRAAAAPTGTSTAKAVATSAPAKTAGPAKSAAPAKTAAPVASGTKPSWGF